MKSCRIFAVTFIVTFILSWTGIMHAVQYAYANSPSGSVTVQLIVLNAATPVTSAAPPGGIYNSPQTVTLSCTDVGGAGCGSIFYTTDGSIPTASSTLYTAPILISSNTNLKYFSEDIHGQGGSVGSQVYVIDTVAPVTTAYLPGGTYGAPISVTLTCTDDNSGCAMTYYTTDGSTPTASSSVYTGPILITATTTLKFFSVDLAGNAESPQTEDYIIDTTFPITTITSGPTNPTTDTSATFTFISDKPGTFQCKIDGGSYAACTSPQSYSGLTYGSHTFTVRSTDTLGHVEPSPPFFTWTISSPAEPSSPGSGNTIIPGNVELIFENESILASTTSAVVTWYTSEPTISVVSWGSDMDNASGSVSEIQYSIGHSVLLENLQPDQEYTVSVQATSPYGEVKYVSYGFQTLPLAVPPENVTDLSAKLSFGQNVALSWANPDEADFDSVLITRGTRFFPRDPGEGFIVYQGTGESALDLDATRGNMYYYSAFVKNKSGQYSSGVGVEFFFGPSASSSSSSSLQSSSSANSPTTPLFGGTVSMLPIPTPVISTPGNISTASSGSETGWIVFENGATILTPAITGTASNPFITLSIDPSLTLSITVPPAVVPRDTEEIVMKVSNIEEDGGNLYFLFQKKSDGSYQTTIPAWFAYEKDQSPFTISFLSEGSDVRLSGVFIVGKSSGGSAPTSASGNGFTISFFWLLIILILILLLIMLFIFSRYSISRRSVDDDIQNN